MNVEVFHKIIPVPLFNIDVDLFLTKDFQAAEDHAEDLYPGIGLTLSNTMRGASLMIKHATKGVKLIIVIDVDAPESKDELYSQMLIQSTHVAWMVCEMLSIDVYIENHTTHSHIIKHIFGKIKETYREAIDTTKVDDL